MSRILIAGCGYVGSALARELVAESHTVFGLRRHAASLPPGVEAIAADLAVRRSLAELPTELESVVYAASPGGRDAALYRTTFVNGLRNLLDALEAQGQRPRRVIFVSSTGVYGQSRGEWVDEGSATEPADESGRLLLEGESVLRGGPFPGVVLRLGGIYGPRRTRLVEQVRQGHAAIARGATRYTNRIHRDDCVGALHHLLRIDDPADVYLGVDHAPEDEAVVLRWLAGALGAPPPRVAARGEETARRRRGNKRCRNDRLVASGYAFRYPTYREGYAALLAEMR